MQLLGLAPGVAVAVFAEVLNHQTHIFDVANARLGMAEPEALWVLFHDGGGALHQLRRGRRGRRPLVQFGLRGYGNNFPVVQGAMVWSSRAAPTALCLTEAIPFSMAAGEEYISLLPRVSPLVALSEKNGWPFFAVFRSNC